MNPMEKFLVQLNEREESEGGSEIRKGLQDFW